jgi:hypothetical protein
MQLSMPRYFIIAVLSLAFISCIWVVTTRATPIRADMLGISPAAAGTAAADAPCGAFVQLLQKEQAEIEAHHAELNELEHEIAMARQELAATRKEPQAAKQ